MKLLYLEIQGFKTFSSKTKLTFTDGISAVVGPNGSGKSNISDAIKWALGEQSSKNLRCSRMEDVIFNGSDKGSARGIAEVSVAFDNFEGKMNLDSNEVKITRSYSRSGESEYLINGKSVRLKDINELFMDTGVGRDGYSVISQGKIDYIVSAKSEERREIFEEAAGISKYRYRKADAMSKLKEADENLIRLNDIMSDLKKRVEPLCKQAKKAEEYIKYREEQKILELGIFSIDIKKYRSILKEYDEKLNSLYELRLKVDEDLEYINNNTENVFSRNNELLCEVDKFRRQISDMEKQLSESEKEVSLIDNDYRHNGENILNFKSNIDEINKSLINNTFVIRNKRIDYESKIKNTQKYKEILEDYSDKHNQVINSADRYEKKKLEITSKISFFEGQASEYKIKIGIAESYMKDSDIKEENIEKLINKISLDKCNLNDKIKRYKDDIERCEQTINTFNDRIGSLDKDIYDKNLEYQKTVKLYEFRSSYFQDKIRRVTLLEEMEKNMEGFSQSVRCIVKESERGGLSGICGPVSRIINVSERYSTAIGIALSMSSQNIVTKTEQDAKNAILYLKSNSYGRATFLPISIIKGSAINKNQICNIDGFINIAKGVCKYNPEYDNIVSYLLGRVIIASDLDSASKIAKLISYKFKIVTLDGQVINSGGALTGGAVSKSVGVFGRESEIKSIKCEIDKLKAEISKIKSNISCLESEKNQIENKKLGVLREKEVLTREKLNKETEIRVLNAELSSVLIRANSLEKEKMELVKKKYILNEDISSYKTEIKIIEQEMLVLMNELTGIENKNKNFNLERERISQDIHEARLNFRVFSEDIERIENELVSLEGERKKLNLQIKNSESTISELKSKNDSITEKSSELKSNINRLNDEIRIYRIKLEESSHKRLQLEKESSEFRIQEKEYSIKREKISSEIVLAEERKVSVSSEYKSVSDKLWNEYGLTNREAEKFEEYIKDTRESKKRLNELKSIIKSYGIINLGAIEEYSEVNDKYIFMKEQIADIIKSKESLKRLINNLTEKMEKIFFERFNQISENFSIIFKNLFGGGNAEIFISDRNHILSSGIEISVCPPGKVVSRIESLSGGEKALVAIALYFAIMKVNPPPFCVLDEIEAALDDVNVDRFASYIQGISDKTQFIIITHRRGTMEKADVLYGVTMQEEGISKILMLDMSKLEVLNGI